MKTLKKAISLLTYQERKRGLLVLLLVMGMALLETAGVASVMPFLAVLGNPQMLITNPILSSLFKYAQGFGITTPDDFLIILGLGAFALIIISAVYRIATHYIMNRYIEMKRHSIGSRLLENYLRQPYSFFLDRHSGDMSKAILSEVDQLIGSVFRPAYSMLASSLVLLAITTLLIMVNFWLTLLAVSLLGGLYALVFLSLKHKLKGMGETLVESNKERFLAAAEAFGGIKDIKILGREKSYLSRFSQPSEQFASTHANNHTLNQVPNFLIEAIIFGAMLLLTIILMVSSGGLSSSLLGKILPTIGLYAFAAYRMKPAVHHIYEGLASLRYGQAVVNNLYFDLKPAVTPEPLPKNEFESFKAKNTIALKQLSYTYPKASKPSLIDLNLNIPVNSSIGLVGSTGAGKTTLVDLILGLLRPTYGAITVDGIPIKDNEIRAWQQSLGYVPQDIFLTDSSVAENIAMGISLDKIDHEQVIQCASMAQVHEFIMKDMPDQYNTVVGERGVRLSGGQRQRIGIARALYHNPEVLVFDEATSALDSVTERAVMDAIDDIAQQKTIILIAHRLSTVRNCDQIVLLDQGRVKSKGVYVELIENNEQFRKMAE